MRPWFRDDLQSKNRGLIRSFLQVFRKEVGTPSAPAADAEDSSEQAISMSFSLKSISDSFGPPPEELKKAGMSFTVHSGLGWTNTDLYWSDKTVAA